MALGFYRFYGLTIFPIDHGRLVGVLPIGLLGSGFLLLPGVLLVPIALCVLGEASQVLFLGFFDFLRGLFYA